LSVLCSNVLIEDSHMARRSASHGSLNRSYTANDHPHTRQVPSHGTPFSQSLRSVNENSLHLSSPGPLESMLKTTTETGDIGLFSIKPVRTPITHHGSSGAKQVFGEQPHPFPRPATSSGCGGPGSKEDIRLPSHRDTASEIISMYGSDSQRSSSLAPPFDNPSHSMTSCCSREPPHQNPGGRLQSPTNPGLLQRPRSPFPYPTRLKRPGVRPSSPALTENGGVDYSRMVAIDRESYVGPLLHLLFLPLPVTDVV